MSDWMKVPNPARGWWWKRRGYLDTNESRRVARPVLVLGVLDDGETVIFDHYPIGVSANMDDEGVRMTSVCEWKKIEEPE